MELKQNVPVYNKTYMPIEFVLGFPSKIRHVYNEVLIFDDIGLLGSLGGSLGLFIGFSFFGYISIFLEMLVDKVAGWTSS